MKTETYTLKMYLYFSERPEGYVPDSQLTQKIAEQNNWPIPMTKEMLDNIVEINKENNVIVEVR